LQDRTAELIVALRKDLAGPRLAAEMPNECWQSDFTH
jgi:hypothetical protein